MVDDEGKANNMKEMNQLAVDCLSSTSFFTEDEKHYSSLKKQKIYLR